MSEHADEVEIAEVRRLFRQGLKRAVIARSLGRSEHFVYHHTREMCLWVAPDHETALGTRRYEDVSVELLHREHPPKAPPVNGHALAAHCRAMQVRFGVTEYACK